MKDRWALRSLSPSVFFFFSYSFFFLKPIFIQFINHAFLLRGVNAHQLSLLRFSLLSGIHSYKNVLARAIVISLCVPFFPPLQMLLIVMNLFYLQIKGHFLSLKTSFHPLCHYVTIISFPVVLTIPLGTSCNSELLQVSSVLHFLLFLHVACHPCLS